MTVWKTKTQIVAEIAARVNISQAATRDVFDVLELLICDNLAEGEPFTIPTSMIKLSVRRQEATPRRKGTNPFTGEPHVFKAKPERLVIKARALKRLKDAVAERPRRPR